MMRILLMTVATMLFASPSYAQDARYQVDVLPDQQNGESVASLHADIPLAVEHALPILWQQILTPEEAAAMPQNVRGIRFLQRAIPTPSGVTVIFDEGRVSKFLENQAALKAASEPQPEASEAQAAPVVHNGLSLELTVDRTATLAEQVLLEGDLSSDARVDVLVPVQLNEHVCKYHLLLKVADDSWIPLWFARHGLAVTPLPEGWIAH